MKKLSIFLCIVMIMTMLPTMGVFADYQTAKNSISFATFKGQNTDQFGITQALVLPATIEDADGNSFDVTWSSSNTNAISISANAENGNYTGTVTRGAADEWVTITATISGESAAAIDITVRVLADNNKVDYLLQENFDDKEISTNDSDITDTTESATDWYFSSATALSEGKATDYKYVADPKGISGTALKMKSKDTISNAFAIRKLAKDLPESGLVSYSMNVMIEGGTGSQIYVRPFANYITSTSVWGAFSTGGSAMSKEFALNQWYNLTVIYDIDNDSAAFYADGEYLFDEKNVNNLSHLPWNQIKLRLTGTKNNRQEIVYVDNIEVKTILADAAAEVKAFNPATKGSSYVDKNLPTAFNGMAVSYESSDEAVIAEDGTVTRSEFFKTVEVTPVVTAGNIVLKGNTYNLTVLPKAEYYKERLYEDFTAATVGEIFNSDGTTKYNGWEIAKVNLSSYASYAEAKEGGVKTEIVSKDGSNALHMEVPAKVKGYRLSKSVEAFGVNDVVALSVRIKNESTTAIVTPYSGLINSVRGWRGDFGDSKVVDDISNAAFSVQNKWQTYLFVINRGITEKMSNKDSHPISLYIDGKYIGTSWGREEAIASYLNVFQIFQNTNGGSAAASSIYVDDILLAKIDIPEINKIQFAETTVADGKLSSVDVQYIYNGTEKKMTAMLAAYNGNSIIGVKKLWTDTDGSDEGCTTVPVDYQLPDATTSYRLFLFDSVDTLIPVAISKEYAVK